MLGLTVRINASILCRVGLVVGLIGGGAREGVAQLDPPEDDPLDPLYAGQWLGPWDLGDQVNFQEGPPNENWAEFAHAAVLPPREAGDPTLILTVARRRLGSAFPSGDGGHVPSIAFLIDPIAILNNADDPLDKLRVLTVNDRPVRSTWAPGTPSAGHTS